MPKEKITLTIDADLLRKLRRLAEIDCRSVSGMVAMIIKRYIEKGMPEEVGK